MGLTPRLSIIVDDMFFAAKIDGAARTAGCTVERVKTDQQLRQDLPEDPPQCVIVDLNSSRLDPLDAIAFLKSHAALKDVPVVAFVSHVETELIHKARAARCDYVLPRSAFSQLLPEIAAGNLAALPKK